MLLTLYVHRYLVPTFSTKGVGEGGWGRADPPMISKTVDTTNFIFGRPLGLSFKDKKNARVEDVSVVRFPGQLIYVRVLFHQIFLKNDRK